MAKPKYSPSARIGNEQGFRASSAMEEQRVRMFDGGHSSFGHETDSYYGESDQDQTPLQRRIDLVDHQERAQAHASVRSQVSNAMRGSFFQESMKSHTHRRGGRSSESDWKNERRKRKQAGMPPTPAELARYSEEQNQGAEVIQLHVGHHSDQREAA